MRSPAAGWCLLYDPAGQTGWAGPLRVIAYIRADLDPDIAEDPLIGQVGWTWLTEALGNRTAGYAEPSGTVTTVVTEGFGAKESEPAVTGFELRASWSPAAPDGPAPGPARRSWTGTWPPGVTRSARRPGLPPLAEGVTALPSSTPAAAVTDQDNQPAGARAGRRGAATRAPARRPATRTPRWPAAAGDVRRRARRSDPRAGQRARGRWPWTPSGRPGSGTATGPSWSSCAAGAPGPC